MIKIIYYTFFFGYFIYCYLKKRIALKWQFILGAVFLHAYYFFGLNGLVFLLMAAMITTTAELLSLTTRFNFFGVGYKYNLQSKFFPSRIVLMNVYPLDVTAAWVLLKYLAFFVSQMICKQAGIPVLLSAVLTASILVSFDLLIDPVAVGSGAWKWAKTGWLFGIPWQNFLGWWMVGLLISLVPINLPFVNPMDFIMGAAVLFVMAVFPISYGKKLMRRNKIQGILAILPICFFIAWGALTLLSHYRVW